MCGTGDVCWKAYVVSGAEGVHSGRFGKKGNVGFWASGKNLKFLFSVVLLKLGCVTEGMV